MEDIFALDTYVIGRPDKFALNVNYSGYDKDGDKLFDVKKKLISITDEYSLVDNSQKTLGVMHKKLISITPFYELYDGNKSLVGKALQELDIAAAAFGNTSTKTYVLEDANGNKIARVKINSPLAQIFDKLQQGEGLEKSIADGINNTYDVTSMDGTKIIAKIARVMNMGSTGIVRFGYNYASFVLNILDNSVSKIALIEFVIAIDHLYSSVQNVPNNPNNPTLGSGFGGGNKPAGSSGSNFTLKL